VNEDLTQLLMRPYKTFDSAQIDTMRSCITLMGRLCTMQTEAIAPRNPKAYVLSPWRYSPNAMRAGQVRSPSGMLARPSHAQQLTAEFNRLI